MDLLRRPQSGWEKLTLTAFRLATAMERCSLSSDLAPKFGALSDTGTLWALLLLLSAREHWYDKEVRALLSGVHTDEIFADLDHVGLLSSWTSSAAQAQYEGDLTCASSLFQFIAEHHIERMVEQLLNTPVFQAIRSDLLTRFPLEAVKRWYQEQERPICCPITPPEVQQKMQAAKGWLVALGYSMEEADAILTRRVKF